MRRQTALTALVTAGIGALLVSYVVFTQSVVRELRRESERSSRIMSVVYKAYSDDTPGAQEVAIAELVTLTQEAGIPLILTDTTGEPLSNGINLPGGLDSDMNAVKAYVAVLDAANQPIRVGPQVIHYGATSLIRQMRIVPVIQAAAMALLLIGAVLLLRTYGRAERDRTWAGMARESAHQIGTPLSSLNGWIEVLRDRAGDPLVESALGNMAADVERLERVSHRFERIGRPPKREPVEVGPMVERVVQYFRTRVPTRSTPVHLATDIHGQGLTVPGDRVLLEWVLESLIKNSVDALAGVGGTITVSAETIPGGRVRIRVADDGPGVPVHLRARIFEAGFTTKQGGWGIGLALTRRIVEENHDGRLSLASSPKGAAFDVILHT
jgi:signal transduction histidine kinase